MSLRSALDHVVLVAVDRPPDGFNDGFAETPPLRALLEHDGRPLAAIFAERLRSRFRVTVLIPPQHADRLSALLPPDVALQPLPDGAGPPFWGIDSALATMPADAPVTLVLAQCATCDPASLARLIEGCRAEGRLTVGAVPTEQLPTGVKFPGFGFADGHLGPAYAIAAPDGPGLARLLPLLRQSLHDPFGTAKNLGLFFFAKVMTGRLRLSEAADALANILGQPLGTCLLDDPGLSLRIDTLAEFAAVRARLGS